MSSSTSTTRKASPVARAAMGLAAFLVLAAVLFLIDPANLYEWVKAGHVIAVIAWMAGLLYLPRLFVYHADAPAGSDRSVMLKVMERRLLAAILNPAMVLTWAFGLWLAWHGFAFQGGWLHAKILAVLALSGVHGYLSGAVRRFATDRNERNARHWRLVNEIPTVLMIAIVVLVIVKPF